MRRSFRNHLLIWLGWSVPAAFLTALSALERPLTWQMVLYGVLPWYYWAAFTIPIVRYAQQQPPEIMRTFSGLSRHLLRGMMLGAGCGVLAVASVVLVRFGGRGDNESARMIVTGILFWTLFGLIFYALITAVGLVMGAQQRLRERELQASQLQARLVEAQLHGLRMQLQPHFLFNTLHTVAMYVRDGDGATSIRVLTRLGELLRHVLDTGSAQEVPLSVEIEHARRYLEIETVRFSDRLQVEIDVPAELDAALLPNLAVQPLIENAIRHGIARQSNATRIEVSALRTGDQLAIRVYNDGPPLVAAPPTQSSGIGLRNTALRLQHLYGPRASLSVANHNGGVEAVLLLPYHTSEAPVHG
jgi:hypothetical protein